MTVTRAQGGPERRRGPEELQVVPAELVRAIVQGDRDPEIDPLLMRDGDPEATGRMSPADFDPADTSGPPDPDIEPPPQDLGGCALTVAVTAGRIDVAVVSAHGAVVATHRLPFAHGAAPGTTGPDAALAADEASFVALTASVDAVLHAVGLEPEEAAALTGIGVVAAGRIDRPAGTVSTGPWRAFPVRDRLQERYQLDVTLLAPATALGAGEHWQGAARGRHNVLAVLLDHGIDGAVVIDGRLVTGTTGNAGHIGHLCVDPYGPACVCGGRGCLQAVAGGAAIADWARTHGGGDPAADARQVAEAARRGDPVALATLRRAGEAIGQAAAGVVTLLDLDVVVIGGPLAAFGSVLLDPITDGYHRFAALGYAAPPRVVPAVLGRDAGRIGAAAAVLHPEVYPVR